jgi:hypothetical protein
MLLGGIQRHITGKRCPFEDRRKRMINLDSILIQKPSSSTGFLFSFRGQIDITPSGILIEFVPFRFPMPQQHQGVEGIFSKIGQLKGRRSRIARCSAIDNVLDEVVRATVAVRVDVASVG